MNSERMSLHTVNVQQQEKDHKYPQIPAANDNIEIRKRV